MSPGRSKEQRATAREGDLQVALYAPDAQGRAPLQVPGTSPYLGRSGMWCLRMWGVMIIVC